jgi:hypothetical protein
MVEPENIVVEHLRHIGGGSLESQYARMSSRLDRVDMRIERIERRLDLIDA